MNNFIVDIFTRIRFKHSFYDCLCEMAEENRNDMSKHKKINTYTNIREFYPNISDDDLFNQDFDLYKKIKIGQSKTRNNIECISFMLMLPTDYFGKTPKQQDKIAHEMIKACLHTEFNLIYAANIVQYGKGTYMNLIAVDKEIYPDGLEINKIANRTVYKRKDNHQCIKNKDIEKLRDISYLAQTKGDVIGRETIYVSTKFREYCGNKRYKDSKEQELQERIYKIILRNFTLKKYKNFVSLVQFNTFNKAIQVLEKNVIHLHNKYYWYNYRKHKAINSYITALNNYLNVEVHKLLKDDKLQLNEARKIISNKYKSEISFIDENKAKFKYMKIGNVEEFEKMIASKIKNFKTSDIGLKWALELFGDKLTIV